MAMRNRALYAAIILLLGVHQLAFADEQTFSISRSLDLYNDDPCIAMNTKTGDVLTVWCRHDEHYQSISRIYAVLCRLKSDGTFKLGKARQISASSYINSDAYVAYSPDSNSYLVVWRIQRNISNSIYIDTQARALSARGKTVGKVVELLPTKGRFEHSAVLAAVPQSVRKTTPNAVFLMSWQLVPQIPEEFETHAGLWTVFLNEKGKAVSTANRVMKMEYKFEPYDLGETKPESIITTDKVPFYISMRNTRLSGGHYIKEAYILKLNEKGKYDGKVLLDSGKTPMDSRIVSLSKKRLLSSWYNFDGGGCYNQLLKSKMKKIKVPYQPVSGTSSSSYLVGLEGGGAFQIVTAFPGFYTLRFDAKGKMQGSPHYYNFVDYLPGDFMAVEIPGQNKVLMVWRYHKGGDSAEIAGTVFELN